MLPRIPERQLNRARRMRREMTVAEAILWRGLRGRGIGTKFRRQVPIGPYVADFACVEARVVVELDGPPHESPKQRAFDARRDAWFADNGWRVLRFPNDLIIGGGNIPLDRIAQACNAPPFSRSLEKVSTRSGDG
jgi:very-short-patch-repair endonuclease